MKPVKIIRGTPHYKKQNYITSLGAFKSKKEADRYEVLLDMQERGSITNLQRKVTFTLLDSVYTIKTVRTKLKTKTKTEKKKVCVEASVTLEANFIYYNSKGKLRVEIVKTDKEYKDTVYILKRKLMRYLHQIVVIEN